MHKLHLKKKSPFTLVEMLISLFFLSLLLTAIASSLFFSFRFHLESEDMYTKAHELQTLQRVLYDTLPYIYPNPQHPLSICEKGNLYGSLDLCDPHTQRRYQIVQQGGNNPLLFSLEQRDKGVVFSLYSQNGKTLWQAQLLEGIQKIHTQLGYLEHNQLVWVDKIPDHLQKRFPFLLKIHLEQNVEAKQDPPPLSYVFFLDQRKALATP